MPRTKVAQSPHERPPQVCALTAEEAALPWSAVCWLHEPNQRFHLEACPVRRARRLPGQAARDECRIGVSLLT